MRHEAAPNIQLQWGQRAAQEPCATDCEASTSEYWAQPIDTTCLLAYIPGRLDSEHVNRYPCDMNKQGWLRCESVTRGMFSDELAVVVARSNGTRESFFVPTNDVDSARQCVRVWVHESGSLMWATLPTTDHATIPVTKAGVDLT